jgi:hypothetical protein
MRRLLAILALLIAAPPAAALEIVSVRVAGPAVVGEPLSVVVEAHGAVGVGMVFPDLQGVVGESACGLRRRAGRTRFVLPYRPTWAGPHVLNVTVTAGSCTRRPRSEWRLVRLDAAEGAAQAAVARTPRCAGADRQPYPRVMRAARLALLCLLNAERAARGLAPLSAAEDLRAAASLNAHRLRRGDRVRAVPGEQRAEATGELSTPRRVLETWLASDAHRRDLLSPAVSSIGVSVLATAFAPTTPIPRLGAVYVVLLR